MGPPSQRLPCHGWQGGRLRRRGGDTEQGLVLPAYRELTRVLEPWLFHQKPLRDPSFTPEDMRRWERRFLDGPRECVA
nr:type VI immunity family protein [Archangium lipolyticum]